MTHFIISKSKELSGTKIQLTHDWVLTLQKDRYEQYDKDGAKIIVIGDYIGQKEDLFTTSYNDIPKLRGNFYAIIIDDNEVSVYSSFLNVLPIYYTTDYAYISSSIHYIREQCKKEFLVDKKFILETLLFNYGFFNRTLYQDISLVPSNSYVLISKEDVEVKQHFEITSLFTQSASYGPKVADSLSALFIETAKQYFPDETFSIAFTSGFDGRTLVSCASYFNKDFETFSFGKRDNDDVIIPKENAAELDIPYQCFDLGSNTYIDKEYLDSTLSFITHAPGGNGFIYPHVLYSTKEVAKTSNYLLSGVVGSELFRALHLTGAITSQSLVDVFRSDSSQELADKIRNAAALQTVNKNEFKTEIEELIQELIAYKDSIPSDLTHNQKFYVFVFEEIFRKFFGQWISMQMQYLYVRTPFLDYEFIKALLQTQYAGANNDFLTENPLKRMKGQYVYADIIRKTNTKIYGQKTGKGYRPKDLRESIYLYKIIMPFLLKRFKRKVATPNLDNLGIISGVSTHKEHIKKLIDSSVYFDMPLLSKMLDELSPYTLEKERDHILMVLSIVLALQNDPKLNSKNLTHYA